MEHEALFKSTVSGRWIYALESGRDPFFPESCFADSNGLLDSPTETFPTPDHSPDHGAPIEHFPDPETPTKALQDLRIAQYFQHFLKTLSPWYDLGDQRCTFGTEIAIEALREPVPLSAVIALSALHISKTTAPPARTAAVFYHAYCVPTLVRLREDNAYVGSPTLVATVCLLRSYAALEGEYMISN